MPTYSYKATNEEGKEVRGSVDAASMEAAKTALQEQKLEDVVVTEAMRLRKVPVSAAKGESKTSYAFEGSGSDGTVRRGTIEAESKRHAFDRLRQEQKLTLSMLSPVGVTPQYKDEDLLRWQRDPTAIPAPVPQPVSAPPPPIAPVDEVPAFHDIEKEIDKAAPTAKKSAMSGADEPRKYFPLVDTLRLYAGWLLAWYVIFVALGYYAFERELPLEIPIVEGFFFSPLIFRFICAIFLFLALSSIHKMMRARVIGGIVLLALGLGLYGATLVFG